MDKGPLRVLFLTPYFRPYLGGIERAIEQLSHEMQRSAAIEAVGVLTTKYSFPRVSEPDWADRETAPDGIAIYRLSGWPQRSLPVHSVPLVWFSPGQVRRFLDEFKPDVIHFVGDGWFWGHFWAWWHYRGKARFVFTPSFHTLPPSKWWLRPINAFLCKVSDRVVALTGQEAESVRRAYLARRDKLGVIGWGAALPDPVSDRESVVNVRGACAKRGSGDEIESRPVTILCVGRLGRHKGQEWLLDVYRQARQEFKRPARLVLVGRDEDAGDAVRSFIAEHGLSGEVTVTGEVSDSELAECYAEADLFTLFSRYEAFGLVYFEAMAHAVPVLTHDVGANRELLCRGAVVVPRFDRETAASELVRLVDDTEARQQMASEAQEYALSEFTWPVVAEKYLAVYQNDNRESRTAA